MIAGTQELQAAEFNANLSSPSHEGFWSPLRKSLTRNLLGYLPEFASLTDHAVLSPPQDKSEKPVVTYIDRQGTGRRLTDESHESMVDALLELEKEGVCEVQTVRMENVSLREQVRLVTRSTVSGYLVVFFISSYFSVDGHCYLAGFRTVARSGPRLSLRSSTIQEQMGEFRQIPGWPTFDCSKRWNMDEMKKTKSLVVLGGPS
jgi:hypothetical protein